jgi:phenylacetate-coenzyme A ligase PaaK-like adenylate-forming protein
VLTLGGVTVTPVQFGVVSANRDVREYQVSQRGEELDVRLVLREGAAAAEAGERVRAALTARLEGLGVSAPRVSVEVCAEIARPPSGKLQLVVA